MALRIFMGAIEKASAKIDFESLDLKIDLECLDKSARTIGTTILMPSPYRNWSEKMSKGPREVQIVPRPCLIPGTIWALQLGWMLYLACTQGYPGHKT